LRGAYYSVFTVLFKLAHTAVRKSVLIFSLLSNLTDIYNTLDLCVVAKGWEGKKSKCLCSLPPARLLRDDRNTNNLLNPLG